MADLGNQKIKDTYQLVLQTDPSGNLQNLSGGTPNPFIINQNLRYLDGSTHPSGYVLVSDGSGNASWGAVAFSGDVYISGGSIEGTTIQLQTTSGNTVSIPGLSWSSSTSGHISNSGLTGNVGIGTSTPNTKLAVLGGVSGSTHLYAGDMQINSFGYVLKGTDNRMFFPASDTSSSPNILYGFWGMQDNGHFYWGTDEDLDIYHNGSQGYIDNDTGTLNILSATVKLGDTTSETIVNDNLQVTDDLTVNTNNLYVDSSNERVGVGTLAPDAILTISGSSLTAFTSFNLNGGNASFRNGLDRVLFAGGATTTGLSPGDEIKVTDGNGDLYTVGVSTVPDSNNIYLTTNFPGEDVAATEFTYNGETPDSEFLKIYDSTTPVFQVSGNTVASGSTDLLGIFVPSAGYPDVTGSMNITGNLGVSGNTIIGGSNFVSGDTHSDNIVLKANAGGTSFGQITPDVNHGTIKFMTKPPGTSDNGESLTISQDLIEAKAAPNTNTPISYMKLQPVDGGQDIISFNDANNDIDFLIKSDTQTAFKLDAANDMMAFRDHVGISDSADKWPTNNGSIAGTPTYQLRVVGKTLFSGETSVYESFSAGTLTLAYDLNVSGDTTVGGSIKGSDITVDAEGDITLDANGADIILSDDGTDFGRFKRDTSDFVIKSETNNKDIIFKGVDDSSTITALTLDMSEAGKATFNSNVISANEDVYMFSNRGQGQADADNWYGPNYQGIWNYSWSKDYGDTEAVKTLEEDYINAGLLVPYDCVLTGFFSIGHTNTGTAGYGCGLWYITQSNLAASLNVTSGQANDATLIMGVSGETVDPGSAKNPLTIDKRGTVNITLAAGSMIYPRVGRSAVVTDTTWNIYLKRT